MNTRRLLTSDSMATAGIAWMLGSLLAAGGCAEPIIHPNLRLLPGRAPYLYSDQDWGAVLASHVRDGLVVYDALAANREPLDRYYALLSMTGPTKSPAQFESRPSRTAYYINAYNACVLEAVLQRYPVTTMYDLAMPVLEHQMHFMVDGRSCTLADLESELMKESSSDVRILFALSGAALGTPRLASLPFRADSLEARLADVAVRALDNPDLCQIDHASKSILIWQKILSRESDFVHYWRMRRRVRTVYLFNVLLDMASPSRRRELQGAVGYQFCEIEFNRKLNSYAASRVVTP